MKDKDVEERMVLDGYGKGALDFVSTDGLKDIIEEIDKAGNLSYYSEIILENGEIEKEYYDYRDFDLVDEMNIYALNADFLQDEYDRVDVLDILRSTKRGQEYYYNIKTNMIVPPNEFFKYLKENKLLAYEDIGAEHNIYLLPFYEEINHKELMTEYVKKNITDKEIRKALFYALRNYDYMNIFYDKLREYMLFGDYIEYSKEYYDDKIEKWQIKNNIKEV